MKKEHHSEPEHIGTIIEQWFKRFELIAKGTEGITLTEGAVCSVREVDLANRSILIENNNKKSWRFGFDQVPDYFEIRIREA